MAAPRKKKPATKKPARKRKPKLPPKQRAFVREYPKDNNGTQAAIRAGYAEKGAAVTASKLLKNPKVRDAIAAAQEKAAKRADITVDEVLKRYWWLATADTSQAFDFSGKSVTVRDLSELPEEVRYAIASIAQTKDGVKVTFHSKTDALAKIGKHLGMFVDVHLIKGEMETLLEKLKNRVSPEEYERALEAFDAPDR